MTLPRLAPCLLSVALMACTSEEERPATALLSAVSIVFGDVPLEQTSVQTAQLSNSGTDPLSLFSVTLVQGASRVFGADGPGSVEIAGGESVDLMFTFEPADLGDFSGRFQVRTSDELTGPMAVDVQGTGTPSTADNDEDGVAGSAGDCDDSRADVFPGAPELCDGRDNDCDGTIPGNETDADHDGVRLCDDDCDDADDNVFPGADEICDGKDSDCDGVNQDSADVDNDGLSICDGDCDDTESRTAPGLTEICDGIDNDCLAGVDDLDEDADGHTVCGVVPDCDDSAASIHPSVVDPSASDGGVGTQGSPFNTLAAGITDATDGCRVVYVGAGSLEVSQTLIADVELVGDPAGGTELTAVEGSRLFTVNAGTLTLRDMTLTGARVAGDGAAVLITAEGALVAHGVSFLDNQSTGGDGGALSFGSNAESSLTNCLFVDNVASDDGGALTVGDFTEVSISDSTFSGNRASDGGAIHAELGGLSLVDSELESNTASGRGGGLFASGFELDAQRVVFSGNIASGNGGGAALATGLIGSVTASVFQHNSAVNGGGMHVASVFDVDVSNLTLVNNIATNDGAAVYVQDEGVVLTNLLGMFNTGDTGCYQQGEADTFAITYSTFFSTVGQDWGGGCESGATGNTTVNPLFVSLDDDAEWDDDTLSLQSTSPARNSGDPDASFDDPSSSRNDRGHTGGPNAAP
jgi:predicted outer membrane repeat protein